MNGEQDEHAALRMVWLAFAGWWLSALWVAIAWLAILLVVPLPTGFRIIAHLPLAVSLKRPGDERYDVVKNTLARIEHGRLRQRPFIVRLVYFIVVGWWFSIGWIIVAWGASLLPRSQPAALMIFMRLPAVMTLRRY
jgi:uncharacterized membrane protein YccF (DUF307 family)